MWLILFLRGGYICHVPRPCVQIASQARFPPDGARAPTLSLHDEAARTTAVATDTGTTVSRPHRATGSAREQKGADKERADGGRTGDGKTSTPRLEVDGVLHTNPLFTPAGI